MNLRKLAAKAAENWLAKVISIVLALGLFVFNRISNLEDRSFNMALRVSLNSSLTPATSFPRWVRVSLRGEDKKIQTIREEDIEAYLDISKYTVEDTYRVPVQIRKKGTALNVDPLEITVEPSLVSIEMDKKVSKYVPLKPDFQGYLEQGYELVSYTLTPSQVMVDGPRRLMDGLSELTAETIDFGGRSEDFSMVLRILNPDALLTIRGDGMTEFKGLVKNLILIRTFTGLPLDIRNLPDAFQAEMEVRQGSLRLQGDQKEMETYSGGDLVLWLDGAEIQEAGVYPLPVQAEFPPAFGLIRCDPPEVTVTVHRRVKAPELEEREEEETR